MSPKIGRWLGLVHLYSSTLNDFIFTDIGKVVTGTKSQRTTTIEVKHPEVQKCIMDYHASMHATICAAVFIDPGDYNVINYDNEPRDQMKYNDGAHYGFEKDLDVDVDVDESVEFTILKIEADMYDQYIDVELQLFDNYIMNWMERVHQILRNADGNTYGDDKYRTLADHTEYEIEFSD